LSNGNARTRDEIWYGFFQSFVLSGMSIGHGRGNSVAIWEFLNIKLMRNLVENEDLISDMKKNTGPSAMPWVPKPETAPG
jgi:hypothetical protein